MLWLSSEPDSLPKNVINYIENASAEHRFVSALTAMEIGLLCKKKRIELPLPPHEWFGKTIRARSLNTISVDWDIAIGSTLLPDFHKDPADRIIVATAMKLDATIVTPDELIGQYDVNVFW